LADAIKHEAAWVWPTISNLPIIRQIVVLPDLVSAQYLAEVSQVSLRTIELDLQEMGAGVSFGCSINFEVAARILRKYGIAAKRGPLDP
jgi:hypothetical protein